MTLANALNYVYTVYYDHLVIPFYAILYYVGYMHFMSKFAHVYIYPHLPLRSSHHLKSQRSVLLVPVIGLKPIYLVHFS